MVDFVIDDYSLNGGRHSAGADERFTKAFASELSQLVGWYRSNG